MHTFPLREQKFPFDLTDNNVECDYATDCETLEEHKAFALSEVKAAIEYYV